MKTKIFSILAFALMLVLMLGFSSALTLKSTPSAVTITKDGGNLTITNLDSDGNFTITSYNASLTFTDSKSNNAVFAVTPNATTNTSSSLLTFSSSSIDSGFLIGEYSKTLNIAAKNYSNASVTNTTNVNVKFINSFCKGGDKNATDLDLSVNVQNEGEGSDNEWLPLDNIKIEVKLENNGGTDLKNVIFQLGLYKKDSNSNVAGNMIWLGNDDEQVKVGSINNGKNKKYTFDFRVDPSEVSDSNYILVVKAYPESDESKTCISHSADLADSDFGSSTEYTGEMSITKETDTSKMIIIDEKSYDNPIKASCDQTVSFTPMVYNIGDQDFNDQIKVTLVNKELGLNLEDIIPGDFNEGDKADASFSFKVPSNAVEKQYNLDLITYYDYDKDVNTYGETSDKTYKAYLGVAGNCVSSTSSVSAVLQSGGKAGESLVVKATIKNTGSKSATYTLNAAGYSAWASSADVSPSSITVAAGQSQDVLITFNVIKSTASGDQTFNLEGLSNGSVAFEKSVSAPIEGRKAFSLGNVNLSSGNWYLWALGALNVILVVVIIFVVVRMVRRR